MRRLLALLLFVACGAPAQTIPTEVREMAVKRNVWIDTISGGKVGSCSGVIVASGYILTALHCEGETMFVSMRDAVIVARAKDADMMLLRTLTPNLPTVAVGAVRIGDDVFTVANYGEYRDVFSSGHIMKVDPRRLFTSVLASPGYSGSALYDSAGRIVGLNTQFHVLRNDHVRIIQWGGAVSGAVIEKFLKDNKVL